MAVLCDMVLDGDRVEEDVMAVIVILGVLVVLVIAVIVGLSKNDPSW